MSAVSDAYWSLIATARHGQRYRRDQVYARWANEEAGDIVGTGFDLEYAVEVDLSGSVVSTTAQLRVLAMSDGSLFVRVWLIWDWPDGEHRAYAGYSIDESSLAALEDRAATAGDEHEDSFPDGMEDADVFAFLLGAMAKEESLGGSWTHVYPDEPTEEVFRRHASVVLAAREAEPGLLSVLSDDELGSIDPHELVDLCDWLKGRPGVPVTP